MKEEAILPMLLKHLRLPTMSGLWEDLNKEAIQQGWSPTRYLEANWFWCVLAAEPLIIASILHLRLNKEKWKRLQAI